MVAIRKAAGLAPAAFLRIRTMRGTRLRGGPEPQEAYCAPSPPAEGASAEGEPTIHLNDNQVV